MPSSARASISQIAFSMGQVPSTSLIVSSRSLILLHVWSLAYNSQIRSDLGCNTTGPLLASNSVTYSVQAQLHHEQLPGWSCTRVLDWALPLREWNSSEAQPLVIFPGPAPGSSISEGTLGSQRFLCLLTTAVESTSSCQHPISPQRMSTLQKETWNQCSLLSFSFLSYFFFSSFPFFHPFGGPLDIRGP